MREPEVGAPTDSDAPTSSVLPRQSIRLLVPLPASLVMTTLAPLEEHTTARAGMLVAGPPLLAHMASFDQFPCPPFQDSVDQSTPSHPWPRLSILWALTRQSC